MRYIHDPYGLRKPHLLVCRSVGCIKEDVSIHPYIKSVTDRNLDSWLNAQILLSHFSSKLPELLPNRGWTPFDQPWES